MNAKDEYAASLWERAISTLNAARDTLTHHPDTSANRAYYAAFYAASALLALEGKYYKKHSVLRSAVHRELVHTGRWPGLLGEDYDDLFQLRDVADYGVFKHVQRDKAVEAIKSSERIIRAVQEAQPDIFPLDARAEDDKTR